MDPTSPCAAIDPLISPCSAMGAFSILDDSDRTDISGGIGDSEFSNEDFDDEDMEDVCGVDARKGCSEKSNSDGHDSESD